VFIKILEELKKIDQSIFRKMGLGEEGPKGKGKVVQKLKYISLPFGTK
jgi:hypothetical protein